VTGILKNVVLDRSLPGCRSRQSAPELSTVRGPAVGGV
jgi:hypothetical protein